MGLKLSMQKSLPIGVDLGYSMLRLAQLRNIDGGLELLAAGAAEVPVPLREDIQKRLGFQARMIRQMLASRPFKGRKAVLCLPSHSIFLQSVKLPMAPPSEVDNMVRGELAGKLPYPVERAVVRSLPAGTVYADGGEMQERIVIAIARDDLDAYLGMAHKAGLEVVGADVQACAVVECFQRLLRRDSDEEKMTLFVDIGSSSTQVVMVRGKKLVFARSLALGGLTLDKELQAALKIPLEQARQARRRMAEGQAQTAAEDELFRLLDPKLAEIADEIARCLVYYERSFNANAVDKAVFLGGEAHNSRLCQCIARRLNLPATIGDPMAGLRLSQGLEGIETGKPQPSWAVAVGLSIGAHCAA